AAGLAVSGSLAVVGTGIRFGSHTTREAWQRIKDADQVLYLLPDRVSPQWIEELNPAARSLGGHYAVGKPRSETYDGIVEEILACVRKGLRVCVALYGHPGVFVYPSHEAIRRARAEAYPAEMLPGVSAEDCLVADLGID